MMLGILARFMIPALAVVALAAWPTYAWRGTAGLTALVVAGVGCGFVFFVAGVIQNKVAAMMSEGQVAHVFVATSIRLAASLAMLIALSLRFELAQDVLLLGWALQYVILVFIDTWLTTGQANAVDQRGLPC